MFSLDATPARTRSPTCSSIIPGVRFTSTSRQVSPPSCWPVVTSKRRSRRRATDALSTLAAVGAKDVSILDAHGVERLRPVADLMVGDRFLVRPGETVATDGVVETGQAVLDCSSMTGESTPIEVGPGDRVIGGRSPWAAVS